jgi:hypothetical protein
MLTAEVLALTTKVETQLVPSTPAVAAPAAVLDVVTMSSLSRPGGAEEAIVGSVRLLHLILCG